MTQPLEQEPFALEPQMLAVERAAIQRALTTTSGHRKRAAQLLRVSLRMLYYKMKKHGLK